MKNMIITTEVPVQFTSKTSLFGGYGHEKCYVGLSFKHSMGVVYGQTLHPDGSKTEGIIANYAVRETTDGLQYYDSYMWKFFDDIVQEAYSGYLAEKELLEK